MRARALPPAYRSYNLYNGYKVVVNDYRGTTPYVYYNTHKVKYPKGYKGAPQRTVGMPPGQAKKVVRSTNHKTVVVKSEGHGEGHGNGNGHGKH